MSCYESKFVIRGILKKGDYRDKKLHSDVLLSVINKIVLPDEIEFISKEDNNKHLYLNKSNPNYEEELRKCIEDDLIANYFHYNTIEVPTFSEIVSAAKGYERYSGNKAEIKPRFSLNYDYYGKQWVIECLLDYRYSDSVNSSININAAYEIAKEMSETFNIPMKGISISTNHWYNGVDEIVSAATEEEIIC